MYALPVGAVSNTLIASGLVPGTEILYHQIFIIKTRFMFVC